MGFTAQDLGHQADGQRRARFAVEVAPVPEGADESFLHIIPGGPLLNARDGRRFVMADASAVAALSELPLLVDIDHRADFGMATEASGWVEALEVVTEEGGERAPGIWGRVRYTDEGRKLVAGPVPKYRFTSAVATLNEAGDIVALEGVSLTNKPALNVQEIAAFSQGVRFQRGVSPEETGMQEKHTKALCSALGLPEDSAPDAIVAAAERKASGDVAKEVETLRASNATLSKEVVTFRERAEQAEGELAEVRKATFETEVDRFLDDASREGKLYPSEREDFRELALLSVEQFGTVKKLIQARPSQGGNAPPSKSGPTDVATFAGLSTEAVETLRAKGWSDERIQESAKFMNDNHRRATDAPRDQEG